MENCPRPLDFVDPMTFRGGPITAAERKQELKKRGLLFLLIIHYDVNVIYAYTL
jgi:hypothetical protein